MGIRRPLRWKQGRSKGDQRWVGGGGVTAAFIGRVYHLMGGGPVTLPVKGFMKPRISWLGNWTTEKPGPKGRGERTVALRILLVVPGRGVLAWKFVLPR